MTVAVAEKTGPVELVEKTGAVELVEQNGRLANQEDHDTKPLQAIRENPWALLWCVYAIWMLILNSFENQAGQ